MFRKKPKKQVVSEISCPFCGGTVVDVNAHLEECPATTGAKKPTTTEPPTETSNSGASSNNVNTTTVETTLTAETTSPATTSTFQPAAITSSNSSPGFIKSYPTTSKPSVLDQSSGYESDEEEETVSEQQPATPPEDLTQTFAEASPTVRPSIAKSHAAELSKKLEQRGGVRSENLTSASKPSPVAGRVVPPKPMPRANTTSNTTSNDTASNTTNSTNANANAHPKPLSPRQRGTPMRGLGRGNSASRPQSPAVEGTQESAPSPTTRGTRGLPASRGLGRNNTTGTASRPQPSAIEEASSVDSPPVSAAASVPKPKPASWIAVTKPVAKEEPERDYITKRTSNNESVQENEEPVPSKSPSNTPDKDSSEPITPVKPGIMEGIVLFDYTKNEDTEIDAREGDSVVILEVISDEWYFVSLNGATGFIAADYVEITQKSNDTPNQESPTTANTNDTLKRREDSGASHISESPTGSMISDSPGASPNASELRKPMARPTKNSGSAISKQFVTLRNFGKKKKSSEFTIARNDTAPIEISRSPAIERSNPGTPDSAASSTPTTPTVEETPVDHRTMIVKEILSTESNYLNIIKALISRYRETLLYNHKSFAKDVSKENVNDIFGNLEFIIPLNEQLKSNLDLVMETWSETSMIGEVFLRVAPFLKMYNQYSNSYNQNIALLNKCMKNETFAQIVDEIDQTSKLGSRLESLLISPIQRIPRYTLLLKELRKNTDDQHGDVPFLEKAIPLMEEVADYINKNMKQVENQSKLISLSLAGAQSLLKPHRVLLHEGILNDKKLKLHVWLFNDIMVVLPDSKAKNKENLNDTKYHWPLHLIWLGEKETKPKSATFTLIGPTCAYSLSGLPDEIDQWVTHIQNAIVQHLDYLAVTQDAELSRERQAQMSKDNPCRFGTFYFPDLALFTGWWNLGRFQGEGTLEFFGNVYEGSFNENLKHGQGELRYVTGAVYTGEWFNDKQCGQGTLTYPNGDTYTGKWVDGKKCGKGELLCKNGDSYSGAWAEDVPQGLGNMYYRNGLIYNGNWENGMRHHYGILVNPSGERYEGEWVAGVRNGKGRMEYFTGCTYDGYWKDGFFHGQGVYTTPNGTYDGEWVADQKEGTGTMTYANGKVYKGQWRKNLYHGTGSLTYPSGLVELYSGEWQANKRHGNGMLRFFSGEMYEGHFKDNMIHGTGTYFFGNGISLKCKWNRGKIPQGGECIFTKPGKLSDKRNKEEVYQGVYKDGRITAPDRPPIYIPTFPLGEIDLM